MSSKRRNALLTIDLSLVPPDSEFGRKLVEEREEKPQTDAESTHGGVFGMSGTNTGTSTGEPVAKSPVMTRMAAFRSGAVGSGSVGAATTLGSLSVATTTPSSSFLTPSTSNLTSAASRPASIFNPGGTTGFGSTTNTTTGGSLFGSTLSKPTTGGLFGSSTSTFGGLGTTQQQQQQQSVVQQQQVVQQYHPFVKACGDPKILGNDNDGMIAKLNQVAASLGVGKAPYKDGNQIQTFTMEGNLFEKFKGIGYNKISERTDDEGHVTLVLKHPIANLNTEERKDKILEVIKTILASGPNVEVRYAPGTSMRSLPDGFTEICIIAKEGGFVASAIKLAQALNDTPKLTQLETQLQVDKARVLPKVGMSKAQRDRYLETVPDGLLMILRSSNCLMSLYLGYDEQIWKQAIRENPAPKKLLPVPVRGWEALRERQRAQVGESKLFNEAIQSLVDRVEFTSNEHARALISMENIRNRHKTLSYRIIRILLAQWIAARFSRNVDADECAIEGRCDTLAQKINREYQVQFFVDQFYQILETKPDKLQESMWTMFDMTMEDEHYARKVLTKFVNICCGLFEKSNEQIESLEACRRALEG
ncbi:hypothetical protein B9Z55_014387 [Caenorhabditis nigoni]|uniref:Nucleoporin Nup54 alpha-helical domain-containing protein n=1 Tax=Caenorhabditis nigoni TaxID=1611254 RepID=A0A2G5U6I0_9PELO|nr:hypothetical protein B9Z55_014387 [Caenorhabditis nigoni]